MRTLILLPIAIVVGLAVAVVAGVLIAASPINYLRKELDEANGENTTTLL